MATLCLGDIDHSAPLLRDWLAGDWGLLFSHPPDFQDQGMEQDRWLTILRDEFRARAVRPLACRRVGGDSDASWVGELSCDRRLVRLHATEALGGVVDLTAHQLRDEIVNLQSRFVLIVDASLNRRGVLQYAAGRTSISPLDLLASIDALRHRFPRAIIGRTRRRTERRRPKTLAAYA